jgi:hypothetical protein
MSVLDPTATQRHIEALRAGLPDALVTPLWTWPAKASSYVTSSLEATRVAAESPGENLYVSVAVLRKDIADKLGPHKRVSESRTAGLVGFTLDLDVIGTPDGKGGVKQTGAPNIDDAITAAHLLAEPTLIILSGGGVQPWWLFDEPLIFSSTDEREHAKLVCRRWQEAHRRACGFEIDHTFDLARVARLAGSCNFKGGGEGAPVSILEGGW